MHRRSLLEMLALYEKFYPREVSVARRIQRLVERHADCFERTCRPGHITGAAWILSADRRRVLLAHHRKLDRWLQLGGHADGHFDVVETARREAQEESGMQWFDVAPIEGMLVPLDVDVHVIPERRDQAGNVIEDAHEHHDIRFLMIARAGQEVHTSHESYEVRWFRPDEIPEVTTEESVLRLLRKCQAWMA
jgi:8-oxo-dGTP pyrophosphatase MutT (NUDIX family)